eukprot:767586-Hanusia_phi.AAC.3
MHPVYTDVLNIVGHKIFTAHRLTIAVVARRSTHLLHPPAMDMIYPLNLPSRCFILLPWICSTLSIFPLVSSLLLALLSLPARPERCALFANSGPR